MDGYSFSQKIDTINQALFPKGVPHYDRFQSIAFDVRDIATSYCAFEEKGYTANDALNVLNVVACNIIEKADTTQKDRFFSIIDDKLPSTDITIPRFLRALPLYPSKQHRKADEVRDLLSGKTNDSCKLYISAKAFLNKENETPFRDDYVTGSLKQLYKNVTKTEYF